MGSSEAVIALAWEPVCSGLAFPEGLRWHDGALWLSDIFGGRVLTVPLGEPAQPVVDVPGLPSGLGWQPDGTLLVVSMRSRQVLAVRDADVTVHSELGPLVGGDCNDMLVDPSGRAYVGNFGYDYAAGHERRSTSLVLVDTDGTPRVVADDLWFPNGMALSADGRTLFVAETPAERVSVFSVDADGSLTDRRSLGPLYGLRPDGLCVDADGALWIASPGTGELAHVSTAGEILRREAAPYGIAQTCVLGGADGHLLFVCSTPTHDASEALRDRPGRVLVTRVEVPRA